MRAAVTHVDGLVNPLNVVVDSIPVQRPNTSPRHFHLTSTPLPLQVHATFQPCFCQYGSAGVTTNQNQQCHLLPHKPPCCNARRCVLGGRSDAVCYAAGSVHVILPAYCHSMTEPRPHANGHHYQRSTTTFFATHITHTHTHTHTHRAHHTGCSGFGTFRRQRTCGRLSLSCPDAICSKPRPTRCWMLSSKWRVNHFYPLEMHSPNRERLFVVGARARACVCVCVCVTVGACTHTSLADVRSSCI
jgi:hypothetical protein